MSGYVSPQYGANPSMGSQFFMPSFGPAAPVVGASDPTAAYTQQVSQSAPSLAAPTGGLGAVLGNGYPSAPAAPGATAPGTLGMNTGTLGLALGGIQTIGSLWNAWEANKLAKEQFAFSKEFATKNLENSVESYNTSLGSQADLRGSAEGWSNKDTRDYVRQHKLSA